jgi:hypothetical protein
MRLSFRILFFASVAMIPMIVAPPAVAGDADVERHGACSGSSRWELDLEREHGRIEVDYEVDQNVSGDTWRIRLRHNGNVFFRGTRETRGDDGSFEVERHVNDTTGTDRFVARSVNRSTGEVCRGSAAI